LAADQTSETTKAGRAARKARVEEARRERQTKGAIYELTHRERVFALAIVAGSSEVEAAAAAGVRQDRAERAALALMRKPIVRAAIFQFRAAKIPEGVDRYQHEVACLALIPDDLLVNKPSFVDKRWALETMLKLQNKFPGRLGAEGGGNTVVLNILVEAAKKRGVTVTALQQPALVESTTTPG
jgi:hypothetical protein